jgi:hypothetical protein
MAEIKLKNESKREFTDISSEEWRSYTFIGDEGQHEEKIENPQYLSRSASGHYILDINGVMHFIPIGWVHLKWKADPHIVA